MDIGQCIGTWIDETRDGIVITHYFNPKHETARWWKWEESISLDVTITPLPKDVIKAAAELVDDHDPDEIWNGKELYELLDEKGAPDVDFTEIQFEEFSMRRGDDTHKAALKYIEANKLEEKYGPNWRTVSQEGLRFVERRRCRT